jgi:hypothetical protein
LIQPLEAHRKKEEAQRMLDCGSIIIKGCGPSMPLDQSPLAAPLAQSLFETPNGLEQGLEALQSSMRDFSSKKDTTIALDTFNSFKSHSGSLMGTDDENAFDVKDYFEPRIKADFLLNYQKFLEGYIKMFFNVVAVGCLDYPEDGVFSPEYEKEYQYTYQKFIDLGLEKICLFSIDDDISILNLTNVFLQINDLLPHPSEKYREFLLVGKRVFTAQEERMNKGH